MYRLTVAQHFDAAHFIRDYKGKCSRMHGHRWEVVVTLSGDKLDERNILIDFGEVKTTIKNVIELNLDHYLLNDTLDTPNVTAEYLAEWLFNQFKARLVGLSLESVEVWESPECCASYSEDV